MDQYKTSSVGGGSTNSNSSSTTKSSSSSPRSRDIPHPYGVLPPGNFFVERDANVAATRRRGLGSLDSLLDDIVLDALSFLNASELSTVVKCSRAMYCYGHYSDLWRDLVLRRSGGLGIQFDASWKDTYFHMFCSRKTHNSSNNSDDSSSSSSSSSSNNSSNNSSSSSSSSSSSRSSSSSSSSNNSSSNNSACYKNHVPIRINGIYSNLLYRSWLSHSFDLEKHCPGILKHSDIQRVDARGLSIEAFLADYETKNIPVIITNGVDDWKAMTKWSKEYLVATCGDQLFRATSATAPLSSDFTLDEYFKYASQTHEEVPLYLFERNFGSNSALKSDYSVPKYFNPDCYPGTDLFRFYGEQRRPDHKWLIAGPARSGSIFHIDPNQTNAWNVCIEGRKKWIFYPVGVPPPGVMSSSDGADVTVPISTGEWLLSFWSFHLEARQNADPSMRPIECTLLPGEIIFVPHGYWHMVVNLDDCIALTHNYVSTSNLSDCLRFLRDKNDQISGVRDRPNTVLPESMYSEMVANLKDIMPEEEVSAYIRESEMPEPAINRDSSHDPAYLNETRRNQKKKKKTKTQTVHKRKWDDAMNSGVSESNNSSNSNCNCNNTFDNKQFKEDVTSISGNSILGGASKPSASGFSFSFSNFS